MSVPSAGGSDKARTRDSELGGGDHLPELAAGMLRGVADCARRGTYRNDGDGDAMRAVCQNARLCGLRAEQLLVVLKESWRKLPEARHLDRYESDEVLARVIHDCIEAYYADPPQKEAVRGRNG